MSIALKRDYNVYISKVTSAPFNSGNTVQLSVKDYSFNQPSSITKVQRETLDNAQERTINPHVSTISPVTFSLTTYINPLVDTNVTSPEEFLWTSLMGSDTISNSPTQSTIDFADGNVGTLHELTIWFENPNTTDSSYRLDNVIVDSANISFSVNEIATIEWVGRALNITQATFPGSAQDRTNITDYLKNRLSTTTLQLGGTTNYTVALTGGSVKFDNNNKFYGRTQLGATTVPTGHYTGNREISGSLNFYLKQGTNLTGDLYEVLRANASSSTYEDTYYANISVNIGGTVDPYIQLNVPRAILEIPRINFEEALTMAVSFVAEEGTGNYSTINYYA